MCDKNILVAKYMGYEIKGSDFIFPKEMYHLYKPYNLYEFESGIYNFDTDVSGMEFHTSWGWLIPVVLKILMGSYPIEGVKKMKEVQNSLVTCSINKTFESVCDFIEWYNNFNLK